MVTQLKLSLTGLKQKPWNRNSMCFHYNKEVMCLKCHSCWFIATDCITSSVYYASRTDKDDMTLDIQPYDLTRLTNQSINQSGNQWSNQSTGNQSINQTRKRWPCPSANQKTVKQSITPVITPPYEWTATPSDLNRSKSSELRCILPLINRQVRNNILFPSEPGIQHEFQLRYWIFKSVFTQGLSVGLRHCPEMSALKTSGSHHVTWYSRSANRVVFFFSHEVLIRGVSRLYCDKHKYSFFRVVFFSRLKARLDRSVTVENVWQAVVYYSRHFGRWACTVPLLTWKPGNHLKKNDNNGVFCLSPNCEHTTEWKKKHFV